jgi:PadR family transcriptional regulator, regulatory protein PadR
MGRQMTEMLKGHWRASFLLLTGKPAYGYEITRLLGRRASPISLRALCTRCSSGSSRKALSTSRSVRPRKDPHAKVYSLRARST